jgi:hypothetical protein
LAQLAKKNLASYLRDVTPKQMDRELRSFSRAARVLSSDHPRLIEKHPNEWVGIHDGSVCVTAKSFGSLISRLKKKGLSPNDTIIRYIDTSGRKRIVGFIMPLTGSFHETVQARARRDVKFRQALLTEAMHALFAGNWKEGRAALRSCINATIGFEKLGAALGRSPKSLMRMFGPPGNTTAENLLGVIGLLQAETGVRLEVRAVADAA